MTTIGSYTLATDFTTAGGGQCRWAFARKGGQDYFLKEYLSPTYPLPDGPGSQATKELKKRRCDEFESHHQKVLAALSGLSSQGGNLVVTEEFFRHKARYYKATTKIDASTLPIDQVSRLPPAKIAILATTVAHSLQILHKCGIVHGDIKPDNILLKETRDSHYAAKLIDFDDCYFSGSPPEVGVFPFDLAYVSPEGNLYVREEAAGANITCASDIFSLGIVFTEYFAGHKPRYAVDKGRKTVAAAALDGVNLTTGLESEWPEAHELIASMLDAKYDRRPPVDTVFKTLRAIREREDRGTRRRVTGISTTISTRPGKSAGSSEKIDQPAPALTGSLTKEKTKTAASTDPIDTHAGKLRGSLAPHSDK